MTTSTAERIANYQSILGLEPERTEEVFAVVTPRAARPEEAARHRESWGGQPIRRGDDSETCIVFVATRRRSDADDLNACTRAAIFPKE